MAWYYIFPLIVIILTLFAYKGKRTGLLILFLFFFFSAFRGEKVGVDTSHYMDENRITYHATQMEYSGGNVFEIIDLEIIDGLFNKIIVFFSLPPRTIIVIYALLTYIFLFYAIKRFKVNLPFACMFFLLTLQYYFSLNVSRQILAVCIILYAFSFIKEDGKKQLLFFVWVIVATLIHATSFVVLPCYFLKYLKINRALGLLVVSVVFIISIVSDVNIMTILPQYFSMPFLDEYAYEIGITQDFSIMGKIFRILIFIYWVYIFIKNKNNTKNTCTYEDSILLLSLLITSVVSSSFFVLRRISLNFTIIQIVYLADYYLKRNRINNQFEALLLMAFIVLCYYDVVTFSVNLVSPYYLCF